MRFVLGMLTATVALGATLAYLFSTLDYVTYRSALFPTHRVHIVVTHEVLP